MKYLAIMFMLFAMCKSCYSLYPTNNYGQQQQLLQQDLLQQQQHLLEQQQQQLQQQFQGQDSVTNLKGYRFSYHLPDGLRREENTFITGLRMDDCSRLDSKTTDFTAVGMGGRPKIKLKNLKLSPGSLKSLSG